MAGKKSSSAATATAADEGGAGKGELQARMDAAREDISQTVAEIKETVTNKYEAVRESVSETLDWREQFRKHSAAWSLGALAVGYVIGSTIAASLTDTRKKKGRRNDGLFAEIAAIGESLSDEFSGVAKTILVPALVTKIKNTFGIDLTDRLLAAKPAKQARRSKKSAKKSTARKPAAKKAVAKRPQARKTPAKKGKR